MGRTYSYHCFAVFVPTCYAEEIVSRWGWGYYDDCYEAPDDGTPYYQSVTSSEKLGLTRFVFESEYYWKNEKMFDDVVQISKQLKCPVFTIYSAGPDSETELILPSPDDAHGQVTIHRPVVVPHELMSLKDIFAIRADQWWDEYALYVVTDVHDESFEPATQLMQNKTD